MAALSASGRPGKRSRLGGALKVIQRIAARPRRPTSAIVGRLLATAGWAVKAFSCWAKPAKPAAPRAARAAATERVGVATISVGEAASSPISDRHAHDVRVGGQKLVSDMKRGFEAEGGCVAGQKLRGAGGGSP